MLQNIRDNAQGVIAKIIIGLIVISFAFFGLESLVGGGGVTNVASINGEDISAVDLNQAIAIQRNRLMNAVGENADPSMLDVNRLREPALNQLIQQRLLIQAADNASIGISDSAVDQAIVSMAQFQENGQFSPQLYRSILRSNGYSLAYFKRLMKDDLVINQLTGGITGSDFVTERELAATAKVIGQKRSFRYFMLPLEKVTENVTVDDAEIEQYYTDNIDSFQTEERVKLAYIDVKQQDFVKPIPEQDVRDAYDIEMDSFELNEERRASHILIEVNAERDDKQAQALINSLAERLEAGEEFAALAESTSDDAGSANNAGDVGYTSGDAFPPEFEEALFALALNEVSKPVKTEAGYHLIVATDIKTASKPTFEERKPVIEQRLQLAAVESEFVRTIENLRDIVFNSGDLAGPAKELELNVVNTDWVSRSTANGLMANRQVLAAVYSDDVLVDGNNSEVIEIAADHFVVVRVLEHDKAHAKELTEVKAEITETVKRLKTTELAMTLAEQSIEQLSQGKTVEELAEENSYQWQVAQSATRNSTEVSREVLQAAFEMADITQGQVERKAVSLANGDVTVIQLEKVEEGGVSDFTTAEQRMIKAELKRSYGNGSFGSFMETLRENAEIEIL